MFTLLPKIANNVDKIYKNIAFDENVYLCRRRVTRERVVASVVRDHMIPYVIPGVDPWPLLLLLLGQVFPLADFPDLSLLALPLLLRHT